MKKGKIKSEGYKHKASGLDAVELNLDSGGSNSGSIQCRIEVAAPIALRAVVGHSTVANDSGSLERIGLIAR
jgi:hypothetical protein